MKPFVIALVLILSGCTQDRNSTDPFQAPQKLVDTSIECRPCDKRGPDIQVGIPISSHDERKMRLCWTPHLDRCWYECQETGSVGRRCR